MRVWEWKKSLSYDDGNNYYLLSIIVKVNSSKRKTFLNQIQKNNTENYSITVYHAQYRNHFYYSHQTNESKKSTERLYSQFNSLTSGNAINNKPRFTLNSVSTKMRCVMHENVKTYPHKEMSISKRIERTDWSSDDVR